MRNKTYYALEHLLRELDNALAGMNEQEQAWILAMLKYQCADKLHKFDAQTRLVAELDATDPLRYVEQIEKKMRQKG